MKAYTFIGAIFTALGLCVLIVGLIAIAEAYSLFSAFGVNHSSYLTTALFTAFSPYLAVCIVFFVIGGIGFWAGSSKEPDVTVAVRNETTPSYSMDAPSHINVSYGTDNSLSFSSNKSVILCGSCGASNDVDAVFCKKCGNRFREL